MVNMTTLSERSRLLLVVLAVSLGCTGQRVVRYTMLPVEGVITLEGKPLADAEVRFDSPDGPRGFGMTDDEGRFTVATRQFGVGLPAGRYLVSVIGTEKTRIGGSDRSVQIATVYQESGVGRVAIDTGTGPLSFELKAKPSKDVGSGPEGDGA